ncbi:promotilin [Sorex fumeus]|uniref:promotilin n=1 Tax=Sorex fumeus TaxID=62283 RepID=UPI0024AD4B2F|nr:promotilin [Sorex fumeus]
MVSRKAVAALLLVHVVTMLAAQAEGFVPIFTHSELQRMQEKEQNRGRKRSLGEQRRAAEEAEPLTTKDPADGEECPVITLTAPVEIGIRMNSRQLEKYWAALAGLLGPASLSTRNGTEGGADTVNIPGALAISTGGLMAELVGRDCGSVLQPRTAQGPAEVVQANALRSG